MFTGTGVASMHYTGMAAMRMSATMTYSVPLLALSVVIAIVAATAALWAALRLRGRRSALCAALIMGAAVSGMHYTGMAAMHLYPASGPARMAMSTGGATAEALLLPLVLGITIVAFVLTATVALSPTTLEISEDQAILDLARSRGLQV